MNEETYDMIEHVIDNAFQGNLNFKFYEFLKANKIKNMRLMLKRAFYYLGPWDAAKPA